MRKTDVAVGDVRIAAVHLDGPGPTVVLVHGMVVAGRGVLPLARSLQARGCAVHVPDLPGFGRSDKPDRALDVEALGEALSGWMRRSGLDGAAVLGNSFGTQVAAACATGGGVAIDRLVLLSPTIDARFRRGWTSWLSPGRQPRATVRSRLRHGIVEALVPSPACREAGATLYGLIWREYLAAGPARALSTYRHALRDDMAPRLDDVAVPVLVVRAGDDRTVSREWATGLAQRARRGRYREVAGVDHDAQFLRPEPLADAISPFLHEGLAAGAGPAERDGAQPTRTP